METEIAFPEGETGAAWTNVEATASELNVDELTRIVTKLRRDLINRVSEQIMREIENEIAQGPRMMNRFHVPLPPPPMLPLREIDPPVPVDAPPEVMTQPRRYERQQPDYYLNGQRVSAQHAYAMTIPDRVDTAPPPPPLSPNERARRLLMSDLNAEQQEMFEKKGYFEVTVWNRDHGHRHRYRIIHSVNFNVRRIHSKTGEEMMIYCCLMRHPQRLETYPFPDHMLAQKIWLETDERQFLMTANGEYARGYGPRIMDRRCHKRFKRPYHNLCARFGS